MALAINGKRKWANVVIVVRCATKTSDLTKAPPEIRLCNTEHIADCHRDITAMRIVLSILVALSFGIVSINAGLFEISSLALFSSMWHVS